MPRSDASYPLNQAVVAAVLLPLPLAGAYDYRVPAGMALEPGSFVRVPLGNREVLGVVWSSVGVGSTDPAKLKSILEIHDVPAMNEALRRLVDRVASYTMTPPGAVLRMCLGPAEALMPPRQATAYTLAAAMAALEAQGHRLTEARRRVLAILSDGYARPAAVLAVEAGCSASVIRAMATAGLLREVAVPVGKPRPIPDASRRFPAFSPEQDLAAAAIVESLARPVFAPMLLDGVTGSGKTEVYFKGIAEALQRDRQVLVLLPEIALGTQFETRFERQFGCRPAVWHSGIGTAERASLWRDVASGQAKVVVGARSALFLPFRQLGLIVVDEEHDSSFKQEDGVVYQARDMAILRASLQAIPIVLASATPSLETLVNVERGRYRWLRLPLRHGGAAMPRIDLVDMRVNKPPRGGFLSPILSAALTATFAEGEQALLFLNRRGYAPLTLCRACGHRLVCPNCTAWLVEHRFARRLVCHHCGHNERPPANCPECGAADCLVPCGPGVERLAEEVAARFPAIRMAVMASDTMPRAQTAQDIIRSIEDRAVDLVIGTQIIAKGHHFPMLTLVGVVDGDLGLAGGDLRAAERTFQLLNQVAGRAGRADRPGRVLVQTYDPEHPVMRALAGNDREGFLSTESQARRERGLPPFGRLSAIIVSAADAESADLAAAALARAAPHLRGIQILGPAPAPLAILRGRHRRRFLVKAGREVNIQAVLRSWLQTVRIASGTRIQVDIDPYGFL